MPTFGSNSESYGVLALVNGDNIPNASSGVPMQTTETEIQIFPNPATNFFHFTAPESGNYEITIYDLLGRVAFVTKRMGVSNGNSIEVNLPMLVSGSYILEISEGKKVFHSQITIIH